jgi:hypothetical protein
MQQLDTNALRSRLKLKNIQSERKLLESHTTAADFFRQYALRPGKIREHATRLFASGALASSLLLSPPGLPPAHMGVASIKNSAVFTSPVTLRRDLAEILKTTLPADVQPLTPETEDLISTLIKKNYGLEAKATLEGNHLNQTYGRMGAEQHLPRFPGDTASAHGEFIDKGITPGLGGWGYVTDAEIEKYYVAVQTLYLPNWNTETERLAKWYKFRRVVVVNPANGKTIVAAVADAGPARWTGKQFGGSPEVMAYLGINYGMQDHPVVLFFLDDPDNRVPLGPVEYDNTLNV